MEDEVVDRSQYIVLVFKTPKPLGINRPEVDKEIASSRGRLARLLLAGDQFGLQLGDPIAGFMFYVGSTDYVLIGYIIFS